MSPKLSDLIEDDDESPAKHRGKSKEMSADDIYCEIGKHFEEMMVLCGKLKKSKKKEDDDGDDESDAY